MSEYISEATCGPYTLVAQRELTMRELLDGSLELKAEARYLVRSEAAADVLKLGAALSRFTGSTEALLQFGNFIGVSELGGRRLVVRSNRLTGQQAGLMLDEVAAKLSSLPFSHSAPTVAEYERALVAGPAVLYQTFAVLRHAMRGTGPHDLPAAVERILARPHESLTRVTSPRLPIAQVDRIEPQTLIELLARPERLRRIRSTLAIADTAAARALHGHLPEAVDATRVIATTDTVENRFVVRVLALCLDISRRLERAARAEGGPAAPMNATEAAAIERRLERWRRHPALENLPLSDLVPQASTVLRGRPGYRELTAFYLDLLYRTRLPQTEDAGRLLELRDAATLYEYWCFFRVVEAVRTVTGTEPSVEPFATSPFGTRMRNGYLAHVDGVRIWFNRSFFGRSTEAGAEHGRNSYSVRLRPDITLMTAAGELHLFDAKLKREIGQTLRTLEDDDEEERIEVATFKRPDLYKMHAYRDAIGARSVWVLYPGVGAELEQFEAAWEAVQEGPSGVGAIPLVPGEPHQPALVELVERLLV